jgi:hypothetical protein
MKRAKQKILQEIERSYYRLVEIGRGVLCPNYSAGCIGHDVGEVGPRVDNAHPRGVELGAGFVSEPCEQTMVG